MAAPSSTPRDRHLVRDPRKQTATARSKEKASFKRIQRYYYYYYYQPADY